MRFEEKDYFGVNSSVYMGFMGNFGPDPNFYNYYNLNYELIP